MALTGGKVIAEAVPIPSLSFTRPRFFGLSSLHCGKQTQLWRQPQLSSGLIETACISKELPVRLPGLGSPSLSTWERRVGSYDHVLVLADREQLLTMSDAAIVFGSSFCAKSLARIG